MGANPHIPDGISFTKTTPLCLAIDKGHLNVVRYFYEVGVNIERIGVIGETYLHRASEVGNLEVVKFLLNTGKIGIDSEDCLD